MTIFSDPRSSVFTISVENSVDPVQTMIFSDFKTGYIGVQRDKG